ncbi:MAG: hypothetical protein AAF439_13495 [Pseudomonadota bacterium]
MGDKARSCFDRLTADEKASLKQICKNSVGEQIPDEHAEVLMSLGLVELSCGDLGPTSAGRMAVIQLQADQA